eukprot:TRINITY_DN35025_c0_g1_i1.p1 TRINITY_DN35025_c0_g1~~TRINITY_DN35025_c0_g1_i1.p1  ORF type:complete len:160 (+),score=35.94 TRINITY_DN35025_c0_g1_i1:168-647(+)
MPSPRGHKAVPSPRGDPGPSPRAAAAKRVRSMRETVAAAPAAPDPTTAPLVTAPVVVDQENEIESPRKLRKSLGGDNSLRKSLGGDIGNLIENAETEVVKAETDDGLGAMDLVVAESPAALKRPASGKHTGTPRSVMSSASSKIKTPTVRRSTRNRKAV